MNRIVNNNPKRNNTGRDYGIKLGDDCICPNCGQREPYQMGVPCYNRRCPKCGVPMTIK